MFTVNGDMFGRYVKIPHVLANDGGKFIFKVVGGLQSNAYYNVPIGGINSKYEIRGAEMVDCLHVIQCGVDETGVLTVALKDCELVEPKTNADRIRNMTNEEYAKVITEMGCTKCERIIGKCLAEDAENGCVNFVKEWLESGCDVE